MFTIAFLRNHWRELLFGFAMCFLSSFGQTFVISLFGGEIRAEFGITEGELGSIYSIGTIASAAVLVWSGRLVDHLRLRDMSALVLSGLAITCIAMVLLTGPLMLVFVVFGLRQFGQGLASHTGVTAAARRFAAERGRAVTIAALGYTAGEALLPVSIVAVMTVSGWRNIWLMAAALLFAAIPAIRWLIGHGHGEPQAVAAAGTRRIATGIDHTSAEVLAEPSLWLRMPAIMAPSFIYTGLIFHQISIVEAKGWLLTHWAGSYLIFGTATACTVIAAGPLVDRFTSRRLIKFLLLPLMLSCMVLWYGNAGWIIPVFMVMMGVSAGLAQVMFGAVWAELFGVKHLGAIRALAQAAMVFSSGLAPAAMGLAMDRGASIETISLSCALYCIGASALVLVAPAPRKEALESEM